MMSMDALLSATSALVTAAFLSVQAPVSPVAQAQQPQAVPAEIFGTWIWNVAREKIDPKLAVYRCYVEVLDDLGGGKVRMRDYRIRSTGQIVQNDASIEFGRVYERPGGTAVQWTVTGPRSYQLGPPVRDTSTGFVVTRDIIEDGKVMRHVGEGLLNGMRVRNEQYFDNVTGPAKSGDCAIQ